MEFQAYPTSSAMNRKGVSAFVRMQGVLHGTDSVVLPATLLLTVGSLAAYQHFTDPATDRHSVRNFLVKLLVSMTPLAVLERKILQCADPVGLFASFSAKVLLMHACFLGLRTAALFFNVNFQWQAFNVVAFIVACVLLPTLFGLRLSLVGLWEHRDVWLLAFVCFLVAFLEVSALSRYRWSNPYFRSMLIEDLISTGSDYIEILAFVPAVWMSYRKASTAADQPLQNVDISQKRALGLFGLMVAFYSVEDLGHAVNIWTAFPAATLAHVMHYMLILDFAGFLLAHLCDPSKFIALKGSFMAWASDLCSV